MPRQHAGLSVDIQIADKKWKTVRGLKSSLQTAADMTYQFLPRYYQINAAMTVLCAGDVAIKKLNRDFRGQSKATNVLSFPQFDSKQIRILQPKKPAVHLGDIALGYQYIVAEAKRDHKLLINHLSHLMIHGILHLFGYDHASDSQASHMERLEKKIMKALGLPDPYADAPKPTNRKQDNVIKRVTKTRR